MNRLPEGVTFHPGRGKLVGDDASFLICAPTYDCVETPLSAKLSPFLAGDWNHLNAIHRFPLAAAVHGEARGNDFIIEVMPEVPIGTGSPSLFSGSFDTFPLSNPLAPVARIYEFLTFGMALVDREMGSIDVWVARPGDKFAVPADAYCALYGLGETLVVLGIQGPGSGPRSDWRERLERFGPPLLGYHDDAEVVFVLNHLHVNALDHSFGVRPDSKPDAQARTVRLPRVTRLELAPFLYGQLSSNLELIGRFHSLGVRIHRASREVILPPDPRRHVEFATPIYFDGPLRKELLDSLVRRYLRGT